MKPPYPALVAATAALVSLPFSGVAAVTLLLTAGLGCIIHADYVQRRCRVRLPRLPRAAGRSHSRPPLAREPHRLAA